MLDLDAELELCERATPGPWEAVLCYDRSDRATISTRPPHAMMVFSKGTSLSAGGHAKECDADFVASARTNYPDCLRRLKRLREILEQAHVEYNDHRTEPHEYTFTNAQNAELRELLGKGGE